MTDRLAGIRARLAAWDEEPCHPSTQSMQWSTKTGGCGFCDGKIAEAAEDFMERFSRPMIVCVECGNKRCPKALWHRNECTWSNATNQVSDYPEAFAPADIAYLLGRIQELTEQRDAARAKLAEAWGEGVDAALEHPTQLDNPYLLPGKDRP